MTTNSEDTITRSDPNVLKVLKVLKVLNDEGKKKEANRVTGFFS